MLAIRAERAFDGERLVRGGVVVLLDEGRIVAVGRDATVVPADVRVAHVLVEIGATHQMGRLLARAAQKERASRFMQPIGEILERPALARLARIARAAE